jgi:DNA-binding response OmpR family regulator
MVRRMHPPNSGPLSTSVGTLGNVMTRQAELVRSQAPRSGASILVVDDDVATSRSLARVFEDSGYTVFIAETALDARRMVEEIRPDLILLDLMLPDSDGLVQLSALKALSSAPIVICSARYAQVDKVLGLKLGADDFVAKPFDIEDLEARVEAVLRRSKHAAPDLVVVPNHIQAGELVITPSRASVSLAGQPIHLTPTEYRLLVALASHPDEVLSREKLGEIIWGYQNLDTRHLVDVHIGRLRSKLQPVLATGAKIRTVRGRGYKLALAETPAESLADAG